MKMLRSQKGSVFIVVAFVLAIIFIFVSLLISLSASELRVAKVDSDKTRANYMAQSGIDIGMAMLLNSSGDFQGGDFSGGSGKWYDPYLVGNAEQLNNVRKYAIEGNYFKQIADIDLAQSRFSKANGGWNPIGEIDGGASYGLFTGTYDGDGYVIENLFVDKPYGGLFSKLQNATLVNIGVVDVEVTGEQDVGALVGIVEGANVTIQNCFVMGEVTGDTPNGSGEVNVGAIVGYNNGGQIQGAYAIANVNGRGSNVGGLIGKNLAGSIEHSYAHISIVVQAPSGVTPSAIGGLVGLHQHVNGSPIKEASITKSYAKGEIIALGNAVGGLVGFTRVDIGSPTPAERATVSIDNSYADVAVYAGGRTGTLGVSTGGLVGKNEGVIDKTYSVGFVEGTTDTFGLVGTNSGSVTNSFYFLQDLLGGEGVALNDADMKTMANYTAAGFNITDTGGTFIWLINEGVSYPYFAFAGGDGSLYNPYLVSNADQLDNVRNKLNANYKQTKNISLAAYRAGKGWKSIGEIDPSSPFSGVYDGDGYTVKHLSISKGVQNSITPGAFQGDGLSMWLDADDEPSVSTTLVGSDLEAESWLDKSGEDFHVSRDGFENVPLYDNTDPKYLAFDRDDAQYLFRDGTTSPTMKISKDTSVYLVMATAEESLGVAFEGSPLGSEPTDSNGFSMTGVGSSLRFNFMEGDGTQIELGYVSPEMVNRSITNPNVYYMGSLGDVGGGAGEEGFFYGVNDEKRVSLKEIARSSTPQAINFYVGWDGNPSNEFDGKIYEVMLVNRTMNNFEREGVLAYLKQKWGIEQNPVGLFGYVEGTIQNLVLESVQIDGGNDTGSVAGRLASGATMKNIEVSGVVSGFERAGGLVGYGVNASISHAASSVVVTGNSDVGGVVGKNEDGSLSYLVSNKVVTGSADRVGGIVGYQIAQAGLASLEKSYSTANVQGDTQVGGLIGMNHAQNFSSEVKNNYATGVVTGNNQVGGLLGYHYKEGLANAILEKSYFSGVVTGSAFKGSLVGTEESGSNVVSCFARDGSSDTLIGSGSVGVDTAFKTLSELKNKETYTTGVSTLSNQWDFESGSGTGIWVIEENVSTPDFTFDYGEGTGKNPYRVRSAAQLYNVRNHLNQNFIQTSDINLHGYGKGYDSNQGWKPIGTSGAPFTGNFNGDLYRIQALFIERTAEEGVGLFGVLKGAGAKLYNIALTNVEVKGKARVGALVGEIQDQSVVEGSFAEGSVHGEGFVDIAGVDTTMVGGLVGKVLDSDILWSYTNVDVASVSRASGGLVGLVLGSDSDIQSSYATGDIVGVDATGGLVGEIGDEAFIQNAYARGRVYGKNDVGGLVGRINSNSANSDMIENTYATGEVTVTGTTGGGLIGSIGVGTLLSSYYYQEPDNSLGTKVSYTQLKERLTYSSNWHFVNDALSFPDEVIWEIDEGLSEDLQVNEGFPYFQYQGFGMVYKTEYESPSFAMATINQWMKHVFPSSFASGGGSLIDISFPYKYSHALSIEVKYNDFQKVYEISAAANYRQTKASMKRYVRKLSDTIQYLGGSV